MTNVPDLHSGKPAQTGTPDDKTNHSEPSMVTMRYFAGIAQAAGITEETLELPVRGALTSSLINLLAQRHSTEFMKALSICALVSGGKRLALTDSLPDVANIDLDVLPPFAGG